MGSEPSSHSLGRRSGPCQPPPGLKLAHAAARENAVIDLQINGWDSTCLDRAVYKPGALWKTLSPFPISPSHPPHRHSSGGGLFLPRGRRVCRRRCGVAPPGPRPRQAHPLPPCFSHPVLLLACHHKTEPPQNTSVQGVSQRDGRRRRYCWPLRRRARPPHG
jgi:hypothetical protein